MSTTAVFLTGGTGNVGQAVIPALLGRGLGITVLVRKPSKIEGCRAVVGTLENIDRFAAEVRGSNGIVHLACSQSADRSELLRQDIAGTGSLIDNWQSGPFVYASSSTVYGRPAGVLSEQAVIAPERLYDQSNYVNECQLRLGERQRDRKGAVLLRPALIFAVNDGISERHLLRQIFAQCRQGSRCVFDSEKGLATYGCSFIGGDDFGHVIAESLTRDLSGPFNIAGGFCTWRELIETINRAAAAKGGFVVRADTRPQAGEFRLPQSRTELDTGAFRQATGFQPRETLEELVGAFARMSTRKPA